MQSIKDTESEEVEITNAEHKGDKQQCRRRRNNKRSIKVKEIKIMQVILVRCSLQGGKSETKYNDIDQRRKNRICERIKRKIINNDDKRSGI